MLLQGVAWTPGDAGMAMLREAAGGWNEPRLAALDGAEIVDAVGRLRAKIPALRIIIRIRELRGP